MRLLLLATLPLLVCAKWTCNAGDIKGAGGNICCNKSLQRMMLRMVRSRKKMMRPEQMATTLRERVEREEGGMWEVIVAKSDFAYANYRVKGFHCKVKSKRGAVMTWMSSWGSGAKNAEEQPEKKNDGEKKAEEEPELPAEAKDEPDGEEEAKEKPKEEPKEEPTPKPTTEAPKTEAPKPKRTPNQQLMACCQKLSVHPKCMPRGWPYNLCTFEGFTTAALIGHATTPGHCPMNDLGKILTCASSAHNHINCCRQKGVPMPTCEMFCDPSGGKLRPPTSKEYVCGMGATLESIKSCFKTHMNSLR